MDYVRDLAQRRFDDKLRELVGLQSLLHSSTSDTDDYVVSRALSALIDDPMRPGKMAPRETAISNKIAQRVGREPMPGHLFVPIDARRDLTVASAPGGGYLVDTRNPGDVFVAALYAASVGRALGVQEIPVDRSNAVIPRGITSATPYWLSDEADQLTESTPQIGQVAGTPKTVGVNVELSRTLLKQMSPAANNFVMAELARAVAAGKDAAMIDGTGSDGQPLGLLRVTGIGAESGTTITWAKVCEAIGDVETASAVVDRSALGWAVSPAAAEILRKREKATGLGFIMADGKIDGRPAFVSNSVPSGTAIFGDWSGIALLPWGLLEIGVMTADVGSTLFRTGAAAVRALYTVDVAVLRPASFVSITSIS